MASLKFAVVELAAKLVNEKPGTPLKLREAGAESAGEQNRSTMACRLEE
jgi:hypothetical protein